MENLDMMQIAMMVVAGLGVGSLIFMLVLPYLSGEKKTEQRVADFTVQSDRSKRTQAGKHSQMVQKKRQQVQETLEDLEERQKEQNKVSLHLRIVRAGLDIRNEQFIIFSMVLAALMAVGSWFAVPGNYYLPVMAFFVGAFGFPRWLLNFLGKRRREAFLAEFANAIDIIIRGVRSGLPLNDCLTIISDEIPDPVGPEFSAILEQIRIGIPIDQALSRMYERIPVQEVNFFSIVIAVQAKAGGNLAEALSNLSQVLRERRKLANKVMAFSQEAKSSAAIIGALPLVVMLLVYLTTPDYIMTLFTHPTGHTLLFSSAALMLTGVLVMRKMINFDY